MSESEISQLRQEMSGNGRIDAFEVAASAYRMAISYAWIIIAVGLIIALGSPLITAPLSEQLLQTEPGSFSLMQLKWQFWVLTAIQGVFVATPIAVLDGVVRDGKDGIVASIGLWARRILVLSVGWVIYNLIANIGLVFLVIPGLMAYTLLGMMIPLILFDDVGPFRAVRESFNLVWGNAWRSVGAGMLTVVPMLVLYLAGAFLSGVIDFSDPQAAMEIAREPFGKKALLNTVFAIPMSLLGTTTMYCLYLALSEAHRQKQEMPSSVENSED